MKIIKQNDNSGGLIFKQNTGEKAMKQNYNFGKAWKSYNPGSAYIDIQKVIPINTPFAIGAFTKGIGSLASYILQANGSNTLLSWQWLPPINIRPTYNGTTINTNIFDSLNLTQFTGTTAQALMSSNIFQSFGTPSSEQINYIRLPRTTIASAYVRLNGLFIYDRAISLSEGLYRRNNKLGNELLNVSDIWAEYPLTGAEILNTGGADFVGVRDISGNNRHMPILSLPAGDLESQLAWANTNCFEIW